MSSIVFGIGGPMEQNGFDIAMTAQSAVQIVRRLGAVSGGFLVHALWAESAVSHREAKAAIDLAVAEGHLATDQNGRLVLGPNAHVPDAC